MRNMKTMLALVSLAVLVLAAVFWWQGSSGRTATERAPAPQSSQVDRAGPAQLASHDARPDAATREVGAPARAGAAAPAAVQHGPGAPDAPTEWRPASRLSWPVRAVGGATSADVASGEPTVPVKLAFRALWYLGVDPEAEKTWARAINDPTHPPGVRSDLIVDMIDEGYTDNNHPGKEDLPVILARLEIIERHAPYAMDEVNAAAYEEAYRHLLEMYIRLGGEPREGW
jgi:hypothetical protein